MPRPFASFASIAAIHDALNQYRRRITPSNRRQDAIISSSSRNVNLLDGVNAAALMSMKRWREMACCFIAIFRAGRRRKTASMMRHTLDNYDAAHFHFSICPAHVFYFIAEAPSAVGRH